MSSNGSLTPWVSTMPAEPASRPQVTPRGVKEIEQALPSLTIPR